ncbi:dihydrofolate reductase family protein [Williamsia sterculiae]|uniref:Dihydrofolate reductase n=1 Tax=Williamsia sterculiae TaxID=1344003 RepID=A0A1N7FHK9_9NOCA|nr:dihydrofolate reductase family protein [Williamsia sterculiae]SIR99829.1 Dihydrofolate reductase [Williamsia sterculiae]
MSNTRKLIVQEFLTLDGVMQAPGGPEEDESGRFPFGGWTAPYFAEADAAAGDVMAKWMESTDLLLGRTTYDIFSGYWPSHAEMWPGINDVTKYVVSRTVDENTSDWPHVVFLDGVEAIRELKASDGPTLKVHGSGGLAQTLLEHDLVDELQLMTFPITLGVGKRLFGEGTSAAAFTMVDSLVTPNGVVFGQYRRAGDVETGSVA